MKSAITHLLLLPLLLSILNSCNNLESKSSTVQDLNDSRLSESISQTMLFFEKSIGISSTMSEPDKFKHYDEFRLEMRAYFEGQEATSFPFDFNEQRTFYQTLDSYFFSNTWSLGTVQFGPEPTKYISINLKAESDVMSYIAYGEVSDFIQYYVKTLMAAGDISPTNVGHIALTLKKSDLVNPKVRLLMALHFLTINDQINRRQPL
ncbi:hypothetical protein BFP97_00575 [Roseivirga sp. 4D4]|uniref:hypothetical protein n=1 Tax=Roseivirga sp. 4D4 TaxID=1889784 RepID=UPI000852D68E|nr:hypothetical protein [Roseivirga sp. 4D4]OEK00099.1 hypothetical protein BFP97_00575 [Roseivirga sp. 4D4]